MTPINCAIAATTSPNWCSYRVSRRLCTYCFMGSFPMQWNVYLQQTSLHFTQRYRSSSARSSNFYPSQRNPWRCCEPSQTLPTEDECRQAALGLVAQFPLILGAFEAHRKSQPAPLPCRDTPHAHRVLSQLTGNPEPEAQDVVIMDKLLVIHAEHELNASCFSARVTASTLSDPYAAITSAIGTLSGALHGGANERVLENAEKVGEA